MQGRIPFCRDSQQYNPRSSSHNQLSFPETRVVTICLACLFIAHSPFSDFTTMIGLITSFVGFFVLFFVRFFDGFFVSIFVICLFRSESITALKSPDFFVSFFVGLFFNFFVDILFGFLDFVVYSAFVCLLPIFLRRIFAVLGVTSRYYR